MSKLSTKKVNLTKLARERLHLSAKMICNFCQQMSEEPIANFCGHISCKPCFDHMKSKSGTCAICDIRLFGDDESYGEFNPFTFKFVIFTYCVCK